MAFYPLHLNLSGRPVLVVGLGPVGRRKAAGLVAAGACVTGVDPVGGDVPGVAVRAEAYHPDHLRGMALAFAAASTDVNRRVVADARDAGVWVNSASDPADGDFLVPASWRDGPVTLGVTTSGASPALAARLRDRAAEALGPGAARLARALAELRPTLRDAIPDPTERRRVLAAWADPRWLERAGSLDEDALRDALIASLAK